MRKIINSKNYYQGYDEKENCYICGTYGDLYDNDNIDNNSIEWDYSSWEEEKQYFNDCIYSLKEQYEKRYHTIVEEVVLCGKVGLWNGSPVGGKNVSETSFILDNIGDVDDIEVVIEDNGTITILGYHHDGTHKMNIYFLTENKLNKIGYELDDYRFYEKIYNNYSPIKLPKKNNYFNI